MGPKAESRQEGASSSPLDSLGKPSNPQIGEQYRTVEETIVGMSKRLGREVDTHFVTAFFTKDPRGTLDLPPKPRVDRDLCEKVEELVKPVNYGPRDEAVVSSFIKQTFNTAANRRLSSYELQLLEFAVKHKDSIELQFDYHSRDHAHERPQGGDRRVVFGGQHHLFDRAYTPQEAWSTFLHELAHGRDTAYGLGSRQCSTGVVLSEVKANIYGAAGDIATGIKETARLYEDAWKEVSANMPGFSELNPTEKFRYINILCHDDRPPVIAFMSHADALKEAFPAFSAAIDKRCETLLTLQEKSIPWIDDQSFEDE